MVFECPANEATNYASNRMGHYGNTSCGFFKLESFSSKNQHTQKKLLNFKFWINGEISKRAKI